MEYPTREQAEMYATCSKHGCEECVDVGFCGMEICFPDEWDRSDINGKMFLSMHDALESKQERINDMEVTIYNMELYQGRVDRLMAAIDAKQEELAKAHDLVRRMSKDLCIWTQDEIDQYNAERLIITCDLIAEAEAMVKMHDEIDGLNGKLKEYAIECCRLTVESTRRGEELEKAKDLIRRIVFPGEAVSKMTMHDVYLRLIGIRAEAEAMTGGSDG